jgi:hypothetical protein
MVNGQKIRNKLKNGYSPNILLIVILLLLIVGLVYLFLHFPKKPEQQSKEVNKLLENYEEVKKTSLELKGQLEQISQKLGTSEGIAKSFLELGDKNIKEGFASQLKLFQEKNKELSDKFDKDLKTTLDNSGKLLKADLDRNQQLIKTNLENLGKEVSQPLEKLNSVLLHSGKRGK